MPGSPDQLFYSFDVGPVHFVSVDTEFYYFLNYGLKMVARQFAWLEADLAAADANRAERPWVVLFGHRPMYCSTRLFMDCTRRNSLVRVGVPLIHAFGMERLLQLYV